MTPGPDRVVLDDLRAGLWRPLAADDRADPADVLALIDAATEPATDTTTDDAAADTTAPVPAAARLVLAARRALLLDDRAALDDALPAAREALESCPPSVETALLMAYLAHVEAAADHVDTALLLAIDASLLTEVPAREPSRALLHAHRWLSLALAALDLEELAVAQAVRGEEVASSLDDPADRWRMLLLSAHQHAELAQTLDRRGDADRARALEQVTLRCATAARELDWEPEEDEAYLLDVVQAWALQDSDDPEDALGPLRRVRRRLPDGSAVWLRGFTDLVLARVLGRGADPAGERGEEVVGLLVDAAGAFASAGDRRRYRQSLLELGRCTAGLGRPAEALRWLEAYRADTGRASTRSREMWAEMFVRRSRLREAQRQAAVLRRHAMEDALTGLGNRRSAERRLGALADADRPVSLAVVDVDRFKVVNDEASHLHGDAVLRRVADLLREHSRAGDEVYRWAGDEFLVVLPTATEAQAVGVMERLRSAVAGADWSDLELAEPITVSIGVATAPATEGEPPSPMGWRALFDTADLHLFSAKRSGRNRVRARGPASTERNRSGRDGAAG